MNPIKSLHRLLRDNSVSKIEITATPPFVKLVFDRSELEALLRAKSQIADAVSRLFVRRRVFWEDIAKESPEYVLKSLAAAETDLDAYSTSISSASSDTVAGLSKFIRAWATACGKTHKSLKERLDEIDIEKAQVLGYDWAGEDRQNALRDALVLLRRTVYPLVGALISFLPDEDPTKLEAQFSLDEGLNLISDAALQRSVIPEFDEAPKA